MSDFSQPPQQRDFFCTHCNGRIVIPFSLPSTTGPCPHCQGTIVSPPPPEPAAQAPRQPTPQQQTPAQQSTIRQAAVPVRRDSTQDTASQPLPDPSPAPAGKKNKASSGILPAMVALLLLILAAGGAVFYITKQMGASVDPPDSSGSPEDKEIREVNYIRIGWQKEAYEVLGSFMAATSVEGKLPYVHDPEGNSQKMNDFYGGTLINDSNTPADSFSVEELSEEDRRRGIFLMTYDQPPQFALKDFFRPLAPLEVQYGVDEADMLLSTMANVSNFAMEPLRVHAFFKRTDVGLKLDWETFAQTKFRLFQSFVELPDVGRPETFRVFIVEDVPEKGQGVIGTRTYRLADPANVSDSARINVMLDSEVGRTLSSINWRGSKQTAPVTRTATVQLEWTGQPDNPTLEIKRFICWEFLGLGGKEIPATASNE